MLLHLSCQPVVDTQEFSTQVVLFQSCPYMHLVSSAEDVFDSISNQNNCLTLGNRLELKQLIHFAKLRHFSQILSNAANKLLERL